MVDKKTNLLVFGTFTMREDDKKTVFYRKLIEHTVKKNFKRINVVDITSVAKKSDFPKSKQLFFRKGSFWMKDFLNWPKTFNFLHVVNFLSFLFRNFIGVMEALVLELKALGYKPGRIIAFSLGLYLMYVNLVKTEIIDEKTVVLFFGAYMPSVRLCRLMALEKDARIVHMEYDMLPGFLVADHQGLNADSWPVRNLSKFNKLEINGTDKTMARKYLRKATKGQLNMKTQKKDLPKGVVSDKPIILVAGMEIVGGGIVPRFAKSSHCLSPTYENNVSLLKVVVDLYQKEAQIIYTTHPLLSSYPTFETLEKNRIDKRATFIGGYDAISLINVADVVVTIGSSVGHLALINNKPCVLAGKNVLYGKNCCYEAINEIDLKIAINKALKKGLTAKQKKNFVEYVAREIKHNTYHLDNFFRERYTSNNYKTFFSDYLE